MTHFDTIRKILLGVTPAAALLTVWQIGSFLGLINTILFPPPSDILAAFISSINGEAAITYQLLPNMLATVKRLCWGFFYGSFCGIVLGILIGNIRLLRLLVEPVLTFVMPIPGIALAPLFMVAMGFGDRTIITVGAVAMFFPVVLNIINGVRSLDKSLENAATIMGLSRMDIYLKVQLPWAMTFLISGLKLGLARCWRTIIAVELIATATEGLGFMITESSSYLRTDMFFVGIIVMALIFLFLERIVFGCLEQLTIVKWGMAR